MRTKNLGELYQDKTKSSDYWSVFKGLGIFAVVLGHSGSPLTTFVYLFHLSLFFFVSGFFYKRSYSFVEYSLKKIKSLWLPFFTYGLIFVIIQALLSYLIDSPLTLADMFYNVFEMFSFKEPSQLLGPFWFLPVLFFAMILYDISRRICEKSESNNILFFCVIIAFGICGYLLMGSEIQLFRRIEVSFLILPIIYWGDKLRDNLSLVTFNYLLFISAILLLSFCSYFPWFNIELAKSTLPAFPFFYLISCLGIYFTLFLSFIILRITFFKRIFIILGNDSLHIMALHLLAFKLVSVVDILVYAKSLQAIYSYPISNENFWLAYTIVGLGVPVGIMYVYRLSARFIVEKKKSIS